jgi:hypothetical protein
MFDPNYPPLNAEIESAPLRGQFNGLKALIDALTSINAAQIDWVTTVNPGDPASASVAVVGSTLGFTFGLPRGQEGVAGQTGGVGPVGPPFANAVVDAVNTLPAGSPATVSVSFDGTLVHFVFNLPAGQNGTNGNDGAQGPPGEVTSLALAMSISGTSSNSNAVPTLDTPFVNDPPTLADMEIVRAKMNELITALRR